MSGTAVHILTTEGPVAIQRISEEDPAVSSVICLDGLTQVLPISPAYDAFVRRPVGVIERMTGHGAYRMDVSGRVDDGRSWQLAAYLAHAADMQRPSETTVFATGEVDSRLDVRSVQHVRTKLDALASWLADNDIGTEKAVILVPAGEGGLAEQIAGIPVRAVANVDEALTLAGLETPPPLIPAAEPTRSRVQDRRPRPLLFLFAAALIAAALFWLSGDFARWSALAEQGRYLELEEELARSETDAFGRFRAVWYREWLKFSKPSTGQLDLEGWTYAAAPGGNCDDPGELVKQRMTRAYDGAQAICRVEIRAVTNVAERVVIGRLAYWPDGLGNGDRAARVMRGSHDAAGRTWTLEFDDLPEPGADLRLVVISGAVDINGPQPWYQDLLSQPIKSAAFAAARERLHRLGFDIRALDWHRQ